MKKIIFAVMLVCFLFPITAESEEIMTDGELWSRCSLSEKGILIYVYFSGLEHGVIEGVTHGLPKELIYLPIQEIRKDISLDTWIDLLNFVYSDKKFYKIPFFATFDYLIKVHRNNLSMADIINWKNAILAVLD